MTNKVDVFGQRLASECAPRGLQSTRWAGASRRTANLLSISTGPRATVLYVKDKAEPPGFWGLNSNQLKALCAASVDWYVVLLVGAGEEGYVLTSSQVDQSTRGLWSFSNTDWKVHEGSELSGGRHFSSFKDLSRIILGQMAGSSSAP